VEPVAFATMCSGAPGLEHARASNVDHWGFPFEGALTALRRVFKRTFLSQAFKTTLRLDSPHEARFVVARTINP
jgi:hypothetical protein